MNVHRVISIILADDHEILRDGLKSLFKKIKEVKLVAEASNGKELVQLVEQFLPDMVITDIKMPTMDGVEATRTIRQRFPQIKIIALSNYDEENLISEMINAGADGYLLKNTTKQELFQAVKTVMGGKAYYCNATSKKILSHLHQNTNTKKEKDIHFTKREIEVLQLFCKGMTNKEIGSHLGISARTVETHRQAIQDKTGLKGAVKIALYASQRGML